VGLAHRGRQRPVSTSEAPGGLAVLLRCFSNPKVEQVVDRLTRLASVTRVVVLVDPVRDTANTVERLSQYQGPGRVEALAVEPWGWAAALNAGLDHLRSGHESLVLTVSAEVSLTTPVLEGLIRAAERDGSGCGYARFAGRSEPSYRVPRNTCCVWARRLLEDLGGFDVSGDTDGGMEDYRLVLSALQRTGRLPMSGAIDVPLALRTDTDMEAKLAWERRGMAAAEARHERSVVARLQEALATATPE
jgi:hypothetical protein